jgi:hypothetical protein
MPIMDYGLPAPELAEGNGRFWKAVDKLAQTWPVVAAKDMAHGLGMFGQAAGGQMPYVAGLRRNMVTDVPGSSEPNDAAINAMGEVAGILGSGGIPMAKQGAVGIFGGRLAKTADQAALSRAEGMAAKGVSREQIWNDTGWFQGADGKWRFEIDDGASRMNPNVYGNGGAVPAEKQTGPAASQLWHKDLFDAYPELRRDAISVQPGEPRGRYFGAIEQDKAGNVTNRYPGEAHVTAQTVPQAKSVALHELQHAIQYMENFAPGADFNQVGRAAYQAAPGEIEARNVQRRMFMNKDERRAAAPWTTED